MLIYLMIVFIITGFYKNDQNTNTLGDSFGYSMVTTTCLVVLSYGIAWLIVNFPLF